ncbi:phenylalanine--tRNA ligase subunit alpha [Sphingomonas sp. Mn802worker]|uniref:phenylalanine--tRNA ligase subunit alpha n=1 Tax=Sphingomonas sp. Mn802worker TaxID=629773 RepID=UPI00035F597A|nr:phenylalanine--tRNA ligase subunit alpha [Sphingomonas sp. Mn802worker]
MSDIEDMKAHYLVAIDACAGLEALEAVRVEALGKQGRVTALLKTMGKLSPDERQVQGPAIHGLREAVTQALAARKDVLENVALEAKLAAERVDVTLPVDAMPAGSVHPVSQVMDELAEIFADLGFAVATGPEIEDDWHNFGALNIPDTHPARAMQDTFYLEPQAQAPAARAAGDGQSPSSDGAGRAGPAPFVLRTHTSPVQIRTMMQQKPPLRIIAPGRVYRSDWDATHTPMFHQIEGLVIDKGITLGHLKWTLETFLRAFFERDDVVLRLRPSYFPFTEPSAEVDVGFTVEKGKRVIGGDPNGPGGGWMEVLGSGMVHPKVIAACGLDPDEWQGFAFGCGIDRLAMLKYGIDDLRPVFEGDIRWLKHYGFAALDVPTLSSGVGSRGVGTA